MKPYYSEQGITIYHGDARALEDAMGADVLATDPPYGVKFDGKATKHTRPGGGYIGGDSDCGPDVVGRVLPKVSRAVVFPGVRLLHAYPPPTDIGCVYCPSGAGTGPWGFVCFHPVLFYGKRPDGPRSPSSIQSFDLSDNMGGHPCPKPLRWMTWVLGLAARPGETIIDPFMGSGTTLRAAKDLGCRAIGIEIEERYCEIAARRLAQGVLFAG